MIILLVLLCKICRPYQSLTAPLCSWAAMYQKPPCPAIVLGISQVDGGGATHLEQQCAGLLRFGIILSTCSNGCNSVKCTYDIASFHALYESCREALKSP